MLHQTPDASRVLLFVGTFGDFRNSFKQFSLPHGKISTKYNTISTEEKVCLLRLQVYGGAWSCGRPVRYFGCNFKQETMKLAEQHLQNRGRA